MVTMECGRMIINCCCQLIQTHNVNENSNHGKLNCLLSVSSNVIYFRLLFVESHENMARVQTSKNSYWKLTQSY